MRETGTNQRETATVAVICLCALGTHGEKKTVRERKGGKKEKRDYLECEMERELQRVRLRNERS